MEGREGRGMKIKGQDASCDSALPAVAYVCLFPQDIGMSRTSGQALQTKCPAGLRVCEQTAGRQPGPFPMWCQEPCGRPQPLFFSLLFLSLYYQNFQTYTEV